MPADLDDERNNTILKPSYLTIEDNLLTDEIGESFFPSSVRELVIKNFVKRPNFKKNCFPNGLEVLVIDYLESQNIPAIMSQYNLRRLYFSSSYFPDISEISNNVQIYVFKWGHFKDLNLESPYQDYQFGEIHYRYLRDGSVITAAEIV